MRAGDKTIVLLEVEGDKDSRLRKSLERMVKSEHEILHGSVYRDAATRLRAEKLTPINIKKVCAYLKVDGVIDGTVMQEDTNSYRFILRLRSGASGIIQKKIPMRLTQPRLTEAMSNELAQRLMIAIDNLPAVDKDGREGTRVAAAREEEAVGKNRSRARVAAAVAGKKGRGSKQEVEDEEEAAAASKSGKPRRRRGGEVEADEEEPDKPERVASVREEAEEEEELSEGDGAGSRAARTSAAETGEDEDDDEETDSSVDEEEDLLAATPGPHTTPLAVNFGLSFIGRKLSFDYSGSDPASAPPGFDGTPVPGAYVAGEVYPAVFRGSRSVLAKLGFGFVLDRVFKLNSTVDDGTGTTVSLPTKMWRYGVDLRFRHNFGRSSALSGYTTYASVGYNAAGFSIDKGDAPGGSDSVDVPNVHYKYIDAGVGGRIPIAGKLSLLAQVNFLAPLDTGPIQEASQYGGAGVLGFDTEAALEYQITANVMARAGGRLMIVSYSFDGNGALDDRNQDGQVDVSGASDRYLGGFVTGGYFF